ncbi:hypothetical protein Desti_1889 [Desulfomonile tiedjei DSM 6799]|uniref:Uncharacterized protein n=1 Tax=Desulfomonile tiedjei (strain ATCC 49306 / DSM 6799 / DCB-1) TaxID=706587 RepID=I4C4V6_DESTA|nr:hypothetical protein Desti_1889 [Desulfomonile tiedjei DSM 6799]
MTPVVIAKERLMLCFVNSVTHSRHSAHGQRSLLLGEPASVSVTNPPAMGPVPPIGRKDESARHVTILAKRRIKEDRRATDAQ